MSVAAIKRATQCLGRAFSQGMDHAQQVQSMSMFQMPKGKQDDYPSGVHVHQTWRTCTPKGTSQEI